MDTKNKFIWFVLLSVVFSGIFIIVLLVLFWQQLAMEEQRLIRDILVDYFAYFFAAGFVLLAGIGFMLDWVFRAYIIPTSRLAEEVDLIHSVNPSHRIHLEGGKDFMQLVGRINRMAEQYEDLEKSVSTRINIAKAQLEEEKNILAAIMAELPDAVLICNHDGQIILYNSQAKRYFNEAPAGSSQATPDGGEADGAKAYPGRRYLGIGRSVFDLIDRHIVHYALDEIHARLDREEENAVVNFVLTAKGNRLLRAETVPILTSRRKFSGFIIIFSDITQGLRDETRSAFLLRAFFSQMRHSVASISSAIGILREYPEMEDAKRMQLLEIIAHETGAVGKLIQKESDESFLMVKTQWPLVPVSVGYLLNTLGHKAEEMLGIRLRVAPGDERIRVNVDTYTIMLIFLFLLKKIRANSTAEEMGCGFAVEDKFVHVDFEWLGDPIPIEKLRKWENQELQIDGEGLPLYLKEVLDHHAAEIWPYACRELENRSCMRIYLPMYRSYQTDAKRSATVLPENKPGFYNFDLFSQAGQTPVLDDCSLDDLTFTVFDTETTGLDPGGGDQIISIGALRIVKLQLLTEEKFDQLINPNRSIPAESTRIHGIDDDMVRFKPVIAEVLPMFHQFVRDTILVAHNAAFDMRMLQLCELQTDIKFINPVLDTLLLSGVIHPAHRSHDLDDIAGRLGVQIRDRHSALGDALATAEIFLKMVPLLGNMGIYTLKQAREASKKTYYARLRY